MMRSIALAALAGSSWIGCSTESIPLFPADYAATYSEVRNCRPSIEHGAVNIRVLASAEALEPYTGRTERFPTGALLLKEEYGGSDLACSGLVRFWTVMEQLDDGASPSTLDWRWQKVDAKRRITLDDDQTCITCHAMCDGESGGYLHTCTVP